MARSKLPPPPDFDAMDAQGLHVQEGPEGNAAILSLLGNLTYGWANNETLLIYMIMLLLDSDEVSAAVVFATLNTTRARITLVERLARVKIRDKALERELAQLIRRFEAATRLRNDFQHSTFRVDASGRITHTQSTKIEEGRGHIRFGVVRPVDEARIEKVRAAITEMSALNRDIWRYLPRLRDHLAGGPRAGEKAPDPAR